MGPHYGWQQGYTMETGVKGSEGMGYFLESDRVLLCHPEEEEPPQMLVLSIVFDRVIDQ